MPSYSAALMPRTSELAKQGAAAPWDLRAMAASLMDIASLPGRAYASIGRHESEGYLDALGRTEPIFAPLGDPRHQSVSDDFSEEFLRDPTLPLGIGIGAAARGLGSVGRAGAEALSNAGLSGIDQYSRNEEISPYGMALSGAMGLGSHAMPQIRSSRASMMSPGEAIKVYHGSPASFSKFDLDKVGSQRATTEGWGGYFTADKENARAFGHNIIELELGNDDIQRMIQLNSPLSKQPEFVRDRLSSISSPMQHPDDVMQRVQSMAKDPLYRGVFSGEARSSIWDYDKMLDLVMREKAKSSPIGNVLGPLFTPKDVNGRELVKRAEFLAGGSSKRGNKLLNSYGIIGYSMPSSTDLLAKNKNTTNMVIFDRDVLNRFDSNIRANQQPTNFLQSLSESTANRAKSAAAHAALQKYLMSGEDRSGGPRRTTLGGALLQSPSDSYYTKGAR